MKAVPKRKRLPRSHFTEDQSEVVGLDLSIRNTGIWFASEDTGSLVSPVGDSRGANRLVMLREALHGRLSRSKYPIDTAIIEGYSYGVKGGRLADLGEWGGVVRDMLIREFRVNKLVVVAPATLKKFVLGSFTKGKSGKQHILLATYKKWGRSFDDDNVCDAFILTRLWQEVFVDRSIPDKEYEKYNKAVKVEYSEWG